MSPRWGRLAIAGAVLLLLPALLLAAAAVLVHPDRYKPRIVALVADQTGRRLDIEGPMRIAWGLHPTLTITGVRLSNLPGGSRADMARVERIDATVSLPALLRHRVTVTELVLTGPNLLFEPVGGQPNWVFHADKPDASGGAAPRHGFTLSVLSARVRNGMLTFRFPERTNVVGVRTLDYGHERWRDPLRLQAVLVYRDFQPFTFALSSTPTGGTMAPWNTRLDARAFDATLQASGSTSLSGAFDLAVSLQAPALEQLNRLLPSMRLPALHGLSLSTRLASRVAGELPVPGRSSLRVHDADLGDRVPGLSMSDIRLDLAAPGGTARLAAAGRYRDQSFSVSGGLDMPARLDGRFASRATLALTGGDASGRPDLHGDTLGLHGTLHLDDGRFDGFQGALAVRAATLAAFRPITGPALPALDALSLDADIALPAQLDRIGLQHLSLRATQGELDGNATLPLGSSPSAPVLSAVLHSSRLTLDPLLPAGARDPAAPFMTARLPWAALRDRSLDLSWQADRLEWHGQDWPGLALHIRLAHNSLSLELPDGSLRGQASVAAGAVGSDVPVRLALQADAFPLQPLAGAAGLPGTVTGTMRLQLDLSARGDTPQALAATLGGTMALASTGAGMSADALSALAAPALKQLGARTTPADRVSVRCFGMRGSAANGQLSFSSIVLDTGSLVLDGVGVVDLPDQTLALKLHPLARLAGSRVAVPVVVQGPFSAPKATLDAGGLGKVGLLLDALFGGDHPHPCRDAGLAG